MIKVGTTLSWIEFNPQLATTTLEQKKKIIDSIKKVKEKLVDLDNDEPLRTRRSRPVVSSNRSYLSRSFETSIDQRVGELQGQIPFITPT